MNIGDKLKQLRIINGLTQEELANRCELSKGFISQIERDLTSPSIATLVDILECLGTNLKDFFYDAQDDRVVFHKDNIFIQENKELGHTISWIIPNAQKNAMEPILITLMPSGSTGRISAHPGEEFGYVLSGTVCVNIGQRKFKAKKGESFYYRATDTHFIENIGSNSASILWVSTPPNF